MRRFFVLALMLIWPLGLPAQSAEDDVGYLTGLLQDALSGEDRVVQITGFEGVLSSEARIERLTIADGDGVWLRLEGITLNWRRVALAERRVVVNALTADRLEVLRRPGADAPNPESGPEPDEGRALPSPESSGFRLPHLPVSIEIGEFAIAEVVLAEAVLGEAAVLSIAGNAQLIEETANAQLAITRLDDPGGRFDLNLAYQEADSHLTLTLGLEEPAGGVAARALGLPDHPALSLSGEGEGPLDDWRFDLSFKAAEVERVSGQARIQKITEGHRFSMDFGGDIAPLIAPRYAAFLGSDLRLQARGLRGTDQRLVLENFSLNAARLRLQGGVVLAPSGLPERVAITGSIGAEDGSAVAMPFAPGTALGEAVLALRFDAARSERWQGAIRVTDYDSGDVDFTTATFSGEGQLDITPGAERFNGDIRFETQDLWLRDPGIFDVVGPAPQGQAHLAWQKDQPFLFRNLRAEVAAGQLDSTGAVRWAGRRVFVSALTALQAPRFDLLSTIAGRPLQGAGEVEALLFYQPLNGAFDVTLDGAADGLQLGIAQLDPLLSTGQAAFTLAATRSPIGLEITQLRIANPGIRLEARGTASGDAAQAQAQLRLENTGVFTGAESGPVDLEAELATENGQNWRFDLQGEGRDIGVGRAEIDRMLRGPSQINAQGQVADNTVTLDGLAFSTPHIQIQAEGRARANDIQLGVAARLPNTAQWAGARAGPLALQGEASLRDEVWRMDLRGEGQNIGIGQEALDRLIRGPAEMVINGRAEAGVLTLNQAVLETPGLSLEASGQLGGQANDLAFNASLADLGVIVEQFPGPAQAEGRIQSQNNAFVISADLDAPGDTNARVQGRVRTGPLTANLSVDGSAPLGLANPFIEPRLLSGQSRFALALNGPLSLEAVSGRIDIQDGRLSDPGLNRSIEALNGRLRLAQGRVFPDLSGALPQGGDVAVSGSLALTDPFEAALQIELDDLDIVEPGLFQTTANGALSLRGPLTRDGGTVNGNIRFGTVEARIPDGGGASGAPAIPDMVHVGDSPAARTTRQRAGVAPVTGEAGTNRPSNTSARSRGGPALQIALIAADRVFLRGRGVDAEFGGRVTIGGRPGELRPSGSFELVRGRINLLGQRLELTEGRITLLGDLTPEIRLVAETSFVDGIAQLVLEGPVDEPEISFSSSPELPEDEIIAQIFFGVPISELSAFQLAQIAGGIAALTGGGTEGPLSQAREQLRLDDLDITSDEEGRPGIAAGAYVTENAYADVEIQGDGTTQLTINVDLGSGVTLRGRSSSDGDNGLGVFFERDY